MKERLVSQHQGKLIEQMISDLETKAKHFAKTNKVSDKKAMQNVIKTAIADYNEAIFLATGKQANVSHIADAIMQVLPTLLVCTYQNVIEDGQINALKSDEATDFQYENKKISEELYIYHPEIAKFVSTNLSDTKKLIASLIENRAISYLTKNSNGNQIIEQLSLKSQTMSSGSNGTMPIHYPVVEQSVVSSINGKSFDCKLPVVGGVFDCNTLQFKAHSKYQIAFEDYKPLQFIPSIDDKYDKLFDNYYMSIACNDTIRAHRLKQAHLAAFLGLQIKKALILVGPAGTGKSTYISILEKLASLTTSYPVAHTSLSDFDKDDSLVQLAKAPAVINSDNADKFVLNAKAIENFKKAIQGEYITASQKYKERLDFAFKGLIVQATNDLPRFEYASSAQPILDRLALVVFKKRFRGNQSNIKDYNEFLTNEEHLPYLVGYLLKNVEAFDDWIEHSDDKDLAKQVNEDDSVNKFIDDMMQNNLTLNKKIPLVFLKNMYYHWMKKHMSGSKPLGDRVLKQRLISELAALGYQFGDRASYTRMSTIVKNGDFTPDLFKCISNNKLINEDIDDALNSKSKVECFVLEDDSAQHDLYTEIENEQDPVEKATRQLTVIETLITKSNQYHIDFARLVPLKDNLSSPDDKALLKTIQEFYDEVINRQRE